MVLDESTKQLLTAIATLIGILWAAIIAGRAKKRTAVMRDALENEVIYLRSEIKQWRLDYLQLSQKLEECTDGRLDDSHQERPKGLPSVL